MSYKNHYLSSILFTFGVGFIPDSLQRPEQLKKNTPKKRFTKQDIKSSNKNFKGNTYGKR